MGDYSRKLVVLLESEIDDFTEQDMRRWWRHHCKKVTTNGETFFIVANRFNAKEGVKRLASFGVNARMALRPVP